MAKSKLVQANEKIAEGVVGGYKKIENGVVGGFMKMEEGVVNGFNKITDKFVDEFLTKDGESVEDAKKRLAQEQEAREHSPKVKKQSTPSRNMEDAIRDRLESGFKTGMAAMAGGCNGATPCTSRTPITMYMATACPCSNTRT